MVNERREAQRERMLRLLQMLATENTGWRGFFRRWFYSHEPLRNSAADLLREMGVVPVLRNGTRLVGDDKGEPTDGK